MDAEVLHQNFDAYRGQQRGAPNGRYEKAAPAGFVLLARQLAAERAHSAASVCLNTAAAEFFGNFQTLPNRGFVLQAPPLM